MSSRINFTAFSIGIVFSAIFFFHGTGEANSFPFRAINPGDQLPSVTIRSITAQQNTTLDTFQGKPTMFVFVGADIPTKKKRTIKALKIIKELEGFIQQRGFNALIVDVQGDSPELISEIVSETGTALPFYIDVDKSAYGGLGVFVMPCILLVSQEGKVVQGMGYSRDLPKRLKGEIEIMLGEKTRAQVEEELRPQMAVNKSDEEKEAMRHFKLGEAMIERGQPESALREFKKVVSIEPKMGKAHVHLGCLLLDSGKLSEAKESLARGVELEPGYLPGQICQARIKAKDGDIDEAIDDIGFLMMRNSRNSELHYVLGAMFEDKGDVGEASREYKKAYELLRKKLHNK